MTMSDTAPTSAPSRPAASRAGHVLFTLVAPALLALFLLRVAIPSRLEGARGGLLGLLAVLGDEHALLVYVALFVLLSEVGRYWYRRLRSEAPAGPFGKRKLFRFTAVVLVLALMAFFVRSSVAGVVRVAGPSMLPTLEIGDRVLLNRVAYGFSLPFVEKTAKASPAPRRGDLVVFTATVPGTADGPQRLVKRVLGVPGDVIDGEEGFLRINGWRVPDCDAGPYAVMIGRLTVRGRLAVEYLGDQAYLTIRLPFEKPFPSYTVKPGEVFVVGDDRGISSDSRLWSDTAGSGIPISALEGRVTRVLVGASPDGSLDLSRLLATPLGLEVRQPNLDMKVTRERIGVCLKARPAVTSPPAPRLASAAR
jgi:signal peptidase I